jgi:serine/threonine protein kinase
MAHFTSTKTKATKMQNVSLQALTRLCADVVFLKGLYFEKIKDKNNMFGFSLYSES